MNKVLLFEQYKLIERREEDISGVWKGSHLVLFFMAFVFGSFCTFCFHMLMYMFDEKCVLFPKLMSLASVKSSVMYEFIPDYQGKVVDLDFLSSHWVEKSACYLPTYVPLVSGIFGLVWTALFLMCNSGNRALTGFHRSWWVLPFVFFFSIIMTCVCVYSTILTQTGLDELCEKLSEITGNPTCTYTVNIATLAYEKRIRGVFQAITLTILSAWLHTLCWLSSALLVLLRVLLVIDFQLIIVKVELKGDLERMLEIQEQQIQLITPESSNKSFEDTSKDNWKLYYKNKRYNSTPFKNDQHTQTRSQSFELHDDLSLTSSQFYSSTEQLKLIKLQNISKTNRFVNSLLRDLIDSLPVMGDSSSEATTPRKKMSTHKAVRQSSITKICAEVIDSVIRNCVKISSNTEISTRGTESNDNSTSTSTSDETTSSHKYYKNRKQQKKVIRSKAKKYQAKRKNDKDD